MIFNKELFWTFIFFFLLILALAGCRSERPAVPAPTPSSLAELKGARLRLLDEGRFSEALSAYGEVARGSMDEAIVQRIDAAREKNDLPAVRRFCRGCTCPCMPLSTRASATTSSARA